VFIQHPIKANPVKAGDAKLWVYRRECGYDCQAAEDHKLYVCEYFAWLTQVRHFLSGGLNPPCKPDEDRECE
jgi:hypothetical protein